jgi:hypothetical protein
LPGKLTGGCTGEALAIGGSSPSVLVCRRWRWFLMLPLAAVACKRLYHDPSENGDHSRHQDSADHSANNGSSVVANVAVTVVEHRR